jgi:two-component system, OmpR family, phosphate regulon response regulator OmpR
MFSVYGGFGVKPPICGMNKLSLKREFVNRIMTTLSAQNDKFSEKSHILVVDDDKRIRDLVSRFLHENDFIALTAESAADAREMMARFSFDALVVDVMMPGETGFAFTKDLRVRSGVPVLLLTALGEADDRITGLESGADDYLSKPFEPRELVLRLRAILRRTKKTQKKTEIFRIGPWHFDASQDEIQNGEEIVRLTSVEANLLRALSARAGEVMSREELSALFGFDAGERTIDVQVTRLRRKIEENTKVPRLLHTVRGKGYLLRAEQV